MTHEAPILLFKSVLAFVGGGVIYVVEPVVAQLSDVPELIHTLGFPVAVASLCVAGLVGMFKALSEERKARISDRDQYILQLREDAAKAAESRERLIAATTEQTHEFRSLKSIIARKEVK
jgi:hypothetical protein